MTKVQLAMQMLEVQGTRAAMRRLFDTTMETIRQLPSLTRAEKEKIALHGQERMDDLVASVAMAAASIFDEAEIQALIEFYGSPIGQSIRAKMPALESAGKALGMQWGQTLMEELPEHDA